VSLLLAVSQQDRGTRSRAGQILRARVRRDAGWHISWSQAVEILLVSLLFGRQGKRMTAGRLSLQRQEVRLNGKPIAQPDLSDFTLHN